MKLTEKHKNFFAWAAFGVMVVAFFIYAVPIVRRHYESWQISRQQAELNSLLEQAQSSASSAPPAGGSSAASSGAEQPAVLAKYDEFLALNPDTVGWVNIADGGLSLPVVQADDNEFYLKHDFYKKPSTSGTVFLDKRIDVSKFQQYDDVILYGHNLGTTTAMFNILTKFRSPAYVREHPVVAFDTLYEENRYAIFSVFLASTVEEQGEVFDYINHLKFKTEHEKQAFLDELYDRSLVDTGVETTPDDRFLILSTCTYEFDGARLAVAARRLRAGETPEDFAGLDVTKAPSPLMPDIWYELYDKE